MPKKTFYNLSDEKKQRIITIIKNEFAENDYDLVSISRIVKLAGIAKGSFYQYFEDKNDMYRYVLSLTDEVKMDYVSKHRIQFDNDIEKFLKHYGLLSSRFSMDNPIEARIRERFFLSQHPYKKEVFKRVELETVGFLKMVLTKGIELGQVDKDLDIEYTSKIMYKLLTAVDYIMVQEENRDYDAVTKQLNKMMEILIYGLQGKK